MSVHRRFSVQSAMVGGVLVAAGFVVGSYSPDLGAAMAQNRNGRGTDTNSSSSNSFGFAVDSGQNGFGIVRNYEGRLFVVNGNGMATRVLYSTAGAAPDKPGPQSEQLAVE